MWDDYIMRMYINVLECKADTSESLKNEAIKDPTLAR